MSGSGLIPGIYSLDEGRLWALAGMFCASCVTRKAMDFVVSREPPKRVVVYRYPSADAVHAWRTDPAYEKVRKVGEEYAKYRTFAVVGVSQ